MSRRDVVLLALLGLSVFLAWWLTHAACSRRVAGVQAVCEAEIAYSTYFALDLMDLVDAGHPESVKSVIGIYIETLESRLDGVEEISGFETKLERTGFVEEIERRYLESIAVPEPGVEEGAEADGDSKARKRSVILQQ